MANRRMFSKSVTETDAFYDMPATARALYLHLGMNADDDGVVDSPKRIMRASAASDDDIRVLISKGYIIPFDSGVIVVRHWLRANQIQPSKKVPTVYRNELAQLEQNDAKDYVLRDELGALPAETSNADVLPTFCRQNADEVTAQDSIGKDRLGKDRDTLSGKPDRAPAVREIVGYLNAKTGTAYRPTTKATARLIQARLKEGFTVEDCKAVIDNMTAKWGNDPKMCRYLRPQTLFGTKFESYLQAGGKRYDYSVYDS